MRIRHFGLHHESSRKKLKEARKLLGLPRELPVMMKLKLILETDQDPRLCPYCGEGLMMPIHEFGPIPAWRVKLLAIMNIFMRWQPGFAT